MYTHTHVYMYIHMHIHMYAAVRSDYGSSTKAHTHVHICVQTTTYAGKSTYRLAGGATAAHVSVRLTFGGKSDHRDPAISGDRFPGY